MERELVANPAKPLKIRRKYPASAASERYYDESKSSHFAQNRAAKMAKFHRMAAAKV